MKYFKDQHSEFIIEIPPEDQWYYKEMKLNPDYREINQAEYDKLKGNDKKNTK